MREAQDTPKQSEPIALLQFSLGDLLGGSLALAFPTYIAFGPHADCFNDSELTNIGYLSITGAVLGIFSTLWIRPQALRGLLILPGFMLFFWCVFLLPYAFCVPIAVWSLMFAYPVACASLAGFHINPKSPLHKRLGLAVLFAAVPLVISLTSNSTASGTHAAHNEMDAAAVCRQIAEAQELYHRVDHDRDGRLEYALSLQELTTPGGMGKSYLPAKIANADASQPNPVPYRGYFYRVQHGQGSLAEGGESSWLVNGELTLAYGLVAFPAQYKESGIHTFIIWGGGTLLQEDHGPRGDDIHVFNSVWTPKPQ